MLGKLSFLLLPAILGAVRVCTNGKCVGSTRIAGPEGVASTRTSRPFQVALYSRVGTAGELGFCGGALIQQRWVLTAAHCCYHGDEEVDNVQAILGAYSLYDRYENGRRIINVDTVVIHPQFDATTFENDLALLRLANVVQITDTIDIVRLPPRYLASANFAGQGAVASGWGIAASGVTFVSPTLREYFMVVLTDTQCGRSYQGLLPTNTMCGQNSASGTCKGDNGGPMTMFLNGTQETILIGIASFVDISGCNTENPSVFTRVQRYLDWISSTTGIVIN